MTTRAELLDAAKAFCDAFAAGSPLDTLIAFFSTSTTPVAIEHGLSGLAPFLGRRYEDINGIVEYFTTLTNTIQVENVRFDDYFVDAEVRKVSVKGTGKFTWKETGQGWDETFTYTLDFDGQLKVTQYQVWADSGAAYLARIGQLDGLVQVSQMSWQGPRRRMCSD